MAKKKQFYGMNVGSASMLMIFVILCLVSFAALSIVSANADRNLTKRIVERNTAYYEACSVAEAALADIDDILRQDYTLAVDEESYFHVVGREMYYSIPFSDTQTLHVEVDILYPENPGDAFYRIRTWQVLTE